MKLELVKVQIGYFLIYFFGETSELVNISPLHFSYALIDLSSVKIPFFKKSSCF